MGYAAKNQQKAQEGKTCYLCGLKFQPGEKSNKDHVPPARLFGSSIKQEFMLQLDTLPTHPACNSSFKKDEEYFLGGHPKPAINRHLKTGHFLTVSAETLTATRSHVFLSRYGERLGPEQAAASPRPGPSGLVASAH
ncbi:MAG TPA: hypothetical protein VFY71_08945 [Planctomycetota bacterium]|nr:hypothetical protein [Planctomycetota bacterium]